MASFTLVTSLPKLGHAGARIARSRAWNPRVFAAATPRPIKVPREGPATAEGTTQGASETVTNSLNEAQDKAYSTVEHVANKKNEVANKTNEVADQMSASAQNMADKAKQTMQEAWESTKNTANRAADTVVGKTKESTEYVKDNVVGKTKESAEYVKDNAETVKQNMNSKN